MVTRALARRRSPRFRRAKRYFGRVRSRAKSIEIPLAVAMGFMPAVKDGIDLFKTGGIENFAKYMPKRFIPFDFMTNRWTFDKFMVGTGSIALGLMVHYVVGQRLGLNRALRSAHIPFIRI